MNDDDPLVLTHRRLAGEAGLFFSYRGQGGRVSYRPVGSESDHGFETVIRMRHSHRFPMLRIAPEEVWALSQTVPGTGEGWMTLTAFDRVYHIQAQPIGWARTLLTSPVQTCVRAFGPALQAFTLDPNELVVRVAGPLKEGSGLRPALGQCRLCLEELQRAWMAPREALTRRGVSVIQLKMLSGLRFEGSVEGVDVSGVFDAVEDIVRLRGRIAGLGETFEDLYVCHRDGVVGPAMAQGWGDEQKQVDLSGAAYGNTLRAYGSDLGAVRALLDAPGVAQGLIALVREGAECGVRGREVVWTARKARLGAVDGAIATVVDVARRLECAAR